MPSPGEKSLECSPAIPVEPLWLDATRYQQPHLVELVKRKPPVDNDVGARVPRPVDVGEEC